MKKIRGIYVTEKGMFARIVSLRDVNFNYLYYAPDIEAYNFAKEYGFIYVPFIWVFESSDINTGIIDVFGNKRLFAFNNTGCPSNINVIRLAKMRVEEVFTKFDVPAVILDGVRFPSFYDGFSFFSCFCEYCFENSRTFNFDLLSLRNSLRKALTLVNRELKILRDALIKMSMFRTKVISHIVRILKDVAKDYGGKLYAAVFPPSIAPFVGQDYLSLSKFIEEFHIMLYNDCDGPACLNKEIRLFYMTLLGNNHKLNVDIIKFMEDIFKINYNHLEKLINHNILDEELLTKEFYKAFRILGNKGYPLIMPKKLSRNIINQFEKLSKEVIYFGSLK